MPRQRQRPVAACGAARRGRALADGRLRSAAPAALALRALSVLAAGPCCVAARRSPHSALPSPPPPLASGEGARLAPRSSGQLRHSSSASPAGDQDDRFGPCRLSASAKGHPRSCFKCRLCNSTRDCIEAASSGRMQQDREWRLVRADGLYRSRELNDERLCMRKWMVGCNGPDGLEVCNSFSEVCAESEAAFDEALRSAKYSVCSTAAFMSPSTVTLVFTIPVCLSLLLAAATVAALVHAFHCGLCGCPPAPVHIPILLTSCTLLVFAALCFFSPHFGAGIVGAVAGLLALVAHSAVATADDMAGVRGDADKQTATAQKWLAAAAVSTLAAVRVIWGQGYPAQMGQTDVQLGQACARFYRFFVVDPRLRGPDHASAARFWGYCERDYVADSLWNVTAVVWLSLLLGAAHVLTLVTICYRQRGGAPPGAGSPRLADLSHGGAGSTQSPFHGYSQGPFQLQPDTLRARGEQQITPRLSGVSDAFIRPGHHQHATSSLHGGSHPYDQVAYFSTELRSV
eukprot:TRINITY_DN65982_c0_g1_i1.p1 TRINITY_DN65982_c0_g1~~TRINITY_DN65982_c0_g1_i1.p1  ORF type:complete len:516 (+),score=106.28 TRINITY_DN65982_c0_g1_i1:62-1609(+)